MKYWAYINNEILGPYEKEKLLELPVFSSSTLLCPQTPVGEKTEEWKEASAYPEIATLLKQSGAPTAEGKDSPGEAGNAPVKVDPAQSPDSGLTTSRRLSTLAQPVDPTPPPSQSINSPFEVNQLGPSKNEPKKDEPSYASSFDPLTISQIGKRATPPQSESPASPSSASEQPPEISAPPTDQAPPPKQFSQAVAPSENPPSTDQTESVAEPGQSVPGAYKKAIDDINAKVDTTARIGATKEDIAVLKEKVGQIGDMVTSIRNSTFQQEILEKVQSLERSISQLKDSMAQRNAPAPQTVQIERNSDGFAPPPQQKEEPLSAAEPRQPKQGTETVIVDQGAKGKKSKQSAKKAFKFFFLLITTGSILFGTIISLKYFGGPDLTRFLPFMPAIFDDGPPPQSPATSSPGKPGQAAPGQAEMQKNDNLPEIISFGKQYSVNPGGAVLENKIYEDAAFKKGNFSKVDWQAKKLPDGAFELTANVPLLDNSGHLSYRYRVDYTRKSIKALDAIAQKPLDALLPPARSKSTTAKSRKKGASSRKAKPAKKRSSARSAPPKPAAAKPAPKPAAPIDDEYEYEYEYVYEDEIGAEEIVPDP